MIYYRRNIDIRKRKLERLARQGNISSRVKLVIDDIRSGEVPIEQIKLAASFNHPIALKALNKDPLDKNSFLNFLSKQPKELSIQWGLIAAEYSYLNWSEFTAARSEESEETFALLEDFLLHEPDRALRYVRNWLQLSKDSPQRSQIQQLLSDVTERIFLICEVTEDSMDKPTTKSSKRLDLSALNALYSIARIASATAIGWNRRTKVKLLNKKGEIFSRRLRKSLYNSLLNYNRSLASIVYKNGISVSSAKKELDKIIHSRLFPKII